MRCGSGYGRGCPWRGARSPTRRTRRGRGIGTRRSPRVGRRSSGRRWSLRIRRSLWCWRSPWRHRCPRVGSRSTPSSPSSSSPARFIGKSLEVALSDPAVLGSTEGLYFVER
ncbi:hypothetical protein BDA96_02G259400 [Sorghum bicolor]|nr:hypothetical protein BDA96_02G259400 [Sorghum bicolor]KAG0544252.1 hypothetical protein BDA96_02G259400 [Sorghum bicolor]